MQRKPNIPNNVPTKTSICPKCQGKGEILKNSVMEFGWKPCDACHGTGKIEFRTPPWDRR